MMKKIREPIVEGIFYPSDKNKLERLVTRLVEQAAGTARSAFGIIAPHAGFRYSGVIAASAYKAASGRKIKNVVVLAPIHHNARDEVIFPESDYFRLPLGLIQVDRHAVAAMVDHSTRFIVNDIPHLEEHSIEVQLPFIHRLFPDAVLTPVLVGKIGKKSVEALAGALTVTFEKKYAETLFVVSANLTSFMQGNEAKLQAEKLLTFILSNQPVPLLSAYEEGTISSCGAAAIAVLLSIGRAPSSIELLSSGSSAETNDDYKELVHYAAVGLF